MRVACLSESPLASRRRGSPATQINRPYSTRGTCRPHCTGARRGLSSGGHERDGRDCGSSKVAGEYGGISAPRQLRSLCAGFVDTNAGENRACREAFTGRLSARVPNSHTPSPIPLRRCILLQSGCCGINSIDGRRPLSSERSGGDPEGGREARTFEIPSSRVCGTQQQFQIAKTIFGQPNHQGQRR